MQNKLSPKNYWQLTVITLFVLLVIQSIVLIYTLVKTESAELAESPYNSNELAELKQNNDIDIIENKGLLTNEKINYNDFAVLGFAITPPAFNNGFEIKSIGGAAQRLFYSSENLNFSVLITEAFGTQEVDCTTDVTAATASKTILGGESACYYEFDAIEYIDGPTTPLDQTVQSIRFVTIHNDLIYTLYFPDDKVLSNNEKLVVDSFKFVN